MCGIYGYVAKHRSVEPSLLKSMVDLLFHRGPDSWGWHINKNIGIASRRLRIIDLEKADQPIHNEDSSVWVVFNGEIYNYRSLRTALIEKGHTFYTDSDTEVLVHLYEEKKEEMVKYIEGMFSFCILDEKEDCLFLARDRIGEKPLYYYLDKEIFIFSSEVKGILKHPEFRKRLNPSSIIQYFLYGFIPSPFTAFENLFSLEPASFMKVKNTEPIKKVVYWRANLSSLDFRKPLRVWEKELEDLLLFTVKKYLVSDVALGVFLSGGIDSTLITWAASKYLGSNLEAFTIGFKESGYDETVWARKVADSLGIKHFVHIFSWQECLKLMEKIAYILDNPFCDYSVFPAYLLSWFARRRIKVALSGDGGDECFGGYPKYQALFYSRILSFLKIFKKPAGVLKKKGWARRFRHFIEGCTFSYYERGLFWDAPFKPYQIVGLILPEYLEEVSYKILLEPLFKEIKSPDLLNSSMYLDLKLRLADLFLVKSDRASMLNSLEVRTPFLDREMLRFSFTLPSCFKVRPFSSKLILREILKKYFPLDLASRKKQGFSLPLREWFRKELRDFLYSNLSPSQIARIGITSQARVDTLLQAHIQKREDLHNELWSLLVLELWYRKWFLSLP